MLLPAQSGVEDDVFAGDPNHALAFHGVPGVDREVEQGVFQLIAVDVDAPRILGQLHINVDGFSQRPLQQFAQAFVDAQRVVHRWREWLATGKRQQLRGQLGPALHRRNRGADPALHLGVVRLMPGQQVQVTGDHLQQVVEVMGHAAGQATDGFQLLRLAQLFLGGGTGLHFRRDALLQVVGEFLAQALGDHMFGGLHHNRQHSARPLVIAGYRAVIQVHPDFFRAAVAQQFQGQIAVGQSAASQAGVDHMAVEVGDFRPAQFHRHPQQIRVTATGKHRIAVVVDHVTRRPPQHHHGHRRGQHHLHGTHQAAGPVVQRAEVGAGPVESTNPLGHFPSPAFTAVGIR